MAGEQTKQEIIAGSLTLIAIAAMIVLAMAVVNWQAWLQTYDTYDAVFDDILGVGAGTPVKIRGLDAGEVVSTRRVQQEIDGQKKELVRVEMKIRSDFPLYQNAHASIESPSLLKDPLVVVYQGDEDQPELAEGTILPGRSMASFGRLLSKSTELLEGMQGFLSEENKQRFGNILTQVEDMTTEANAVVADVGQDARSFTGALKKAGQQVNGVLERADKLVATSHSTVEDLQQAVNGLSKQLHGAADDLQGLLRDSDELVLSASPEVVAALHIVQRQLNRLGDRADAAGADLQELLGNANGVVVENSGEVSRIMVNVEETTEHVERFTRELERSPWKLVWKSPTRRVAPAPAPAWVVRGATARALLEQESLLSADVVRASTEE